MSVIEVIDLTKVYAGGTRAVDGVSFSVGPGEFFGFLGPNGAGKTTTIRILATLLRATSGQARVDGLDVDLEAAGVRARIGFAMQTVAIDPLATGRESLEIMGRLHRVPRPELDRRVDELLALMGLTEVADRYAGTYSGGMKRRLDLASALVHRPTVLFLDEPTEGLDPQSRMALWAELQRLRTAGTTMFLTTHYMDEADALCDRIAIIDHGRIVVDGSPADLKRSIGTDALDLRLVTDGNDGVVRAQDEVVRRLVGLTAVTGVERTRDGVRVAVAEPSQALSALFRRLDGGVVVHGISMRQPTLDDVFLHYTGHEIRGEAADVPIELGWWG
jgi:ABC-2 type transport system ATP-binding protein